MRSSTLSPQEIRLEKIKSYIKTFKENNNKVLPSGMQHMLRHIDGGVTPTVSNTTGIIMWLPATPNDKLSRVCEIASKKRDDKFVWNLRIGSNVLFTQPRSSTVRKAYIDIWRLAAGTTTYISRLPEVTGIEMDPIGGHPKP
jgi:hypothetical protein